MGHASFHRRRASSMLYSLPETFGRIEVMELLLLLAYPSAVPGKPLQGFHTDLAAAFLFLLSKL